MNKAKHIAAFVLLMAGLITRVTAQVYQGKLIYDRLEYFNRNGYSEKVILDIDKDIYFAGDKMNFAIFLAEGKYNFPEALSSIVYIELSDHSNQSLLWGKFRVKDSRGAGSLEIPAGLPSGNYILRGYTNWMRNESPEYFFHQRVTILNPRQSIEGKASSPGEKANIGFRVEGGNLVPENENRVVVRFTDRHQQKLTDECIIQNQAGDTLCHVSLDEKGFGSFPIVPVPGETYGIAFRDSNYLLPPANEEAVGIRLSSLEDIYRLNLYSGKGRPSDEELILFIHQNGEPVNFERLKVSGNRSEYAFSRRTLPPGLSELLVLDDGFNRLASRLVKGPDPEAPELHTENKPLLCGKRDSSGFDLLTVPGSLVSASIYLPGFAEPDQRKLANSLYLESIAGPWLDDCAPEYELIYADEGSNSFSSITGNKKILFPPEIRKDLVSGRLISGSVKESDDKKFYCAALGKNIDPEAITFKDDGSFFISPAENSGSTKLVFISDPPDKLNIQIHPEFATEYAAVSCPEPDTSHLLMGNLNLLLIAGQVNKIYTSVLPGRDEDNKGKFYGQADESIYIRDYIELPVMEEFFRELVKYSIFTRENGELKLSVLNKFTNRIIGPDPMYLVDGIPVFDTRTILDLPPELVHSIHIKANKYVYGNTVMDGIIDIESIRGDGSILDLEEKIASYQYEGLTDFPAAEISSVNKGKAGFFIPDQRTVICWQPLLRADSEGKLRINFRTSDISGEYRIKITVFTEDGKIGQYFDTLLVE